AATVASAKLVRPCPKVIKKGVNGRGMEVSSVTQATGGDCDSGEDVKNHCDLDEVDAINSGMTRRTKKASGNSNQWLREAIEKETLFFLNITWTILNSSAAKAAMTGNIQVMDWLNVVDRVTGSQKSSAPSSLLSVSVTLQSTVNTNSSVNTRAMSARYTGPPPTPDIPDNCTGGYGDNEQLEDDSHERAAVILASLAKGKRLPKPSTQSMSIIEVTATEVTKDSAVPLLKRKEPEIEYVSSSEQEDDINISEQEDLGRQEDDNETYKPEEEVEEASQLPAWFHMAGSLCKMNATSVTITEKPSKKVKLESSKNQVHLSMSQSLSMTTPDANASTGQHFNTTSLPSSLSKDGKWRKAVITTLCLWAVSQPNVWNISKQEISDALKESGSSGFLESSLHSAM
ncbi:hypothetical protein PAXRUDRAFT_175816, partial [Paxillus rubicundulus Ve08.2h10]